MSHNLIFTTNYEYTLKSTPYFRNKEIKCKMLLNKTQKYYIQSKQWVLTASACSWSSQQCYVTNPMKHTLLG